MYRVKLPDLAGSAGCDRFSPAGGGDEFIAGGGCVAELTFAHLQHLSTENIQTTCGIILDSREAPRIMLMELRQMGMFVLSAFPTQTQTTNENHWAASFPLRTSAPDLPIFIYLC